MPMIPDTRPSLIVRLQRDDDESAWGEFVAIYRPVIVRVAVSYGLQPTDAEDLAQQVLLSVARSITDWEHDPDRAHFRTWLGRIVRNAATNALSRRKADRGAGGTTALQAMQRVVSDQDAMELLEVEWRREAFRWAADQVRDDFESATWEAFWLTAVEGLPASEAARRTGKSVGAVYVTKSRVMQRLQRKVCELQGEELRKGLA
jgi:RNA polymerase sigma-70 factor (ECF subfamily)